MKLIRKRLEDARKDAGLSWEIIEKDYILSWVLAGIAANVKLQDKLIFKGGTALKKCYFGNYRFSKKEQGTVLRSFYYLTIENYSII